MTDKLGERSGGAATDAVVTGTHGNDPRHEAREGWCLLHR